MNQDVIKRAGEVILQNTAHNAEPGKEPYCALALIDAEGFPTVSTITAAKAQGIEGLAFCTGLGSNKAKRIAGSNRASVCFNSPDYNITLVGTIEVVTDPAVKKEMWYDGMSNHFSGPDHPDYCVLSFKTQRYNLMVDWKEAAGTL
ncbi:MAG: pyridoxamine 5'-phosphate oxidase family protein [Oscillospiraceae bacterium]|jgi:general stress protein 26|nr:pyridoxamine 5'-phosphate oxidase family protein [Oscillospiraceae bacterium]